MSNANFFIHVIFFLFSPVEHCLDMANQRLWLFDIAFNLFFLFYFFLRVSIIYVLVSQTQPFSKFPFGYRK